MEGLLKYLYHKMSNSTNGGTGLSTMLFLIFLVLKLTGVIAWSWWWVFSPIWISLLLLLIVIMLLALIDD